MHVCVDGLGPGLHLVAVRWSAGRRRLRQVVGGHLDGTHVLDLEAPPQEALEREHVSAPAEGNVALVVGRPQDRELLGDLAQVAVEAVLLVVDACTKGNPKATLREPFVRRGTTSIPHGPHSPGRLRLAPAHMGLSAAVQLVSPVWSRVMCAILRPTRPMRLGTSGTLAGAGSSGAR